MRIQMKKLMSFLLAVGILAGSLKFSGKVFAADDTLKITLNGNGGKFTGSVSDNYNPGDALPGYEDITRDNLIFAGWYDNAEFAGNPVYSVPADVSGDTTYYAKWVKQETLFDGFENGLGTGTSAWQDWTGKATMSIDTENVNSGDNSMKYVISENASYIYVTERTLSVNGDGICFWISTEKAATLKLQLDHYNPTTLVSKEINVPAGKSFVTIPWSDITATDKKTLKSLEFQIKTADAGNTYYIDDIGTYSDPKKINFTLNEGKFLNEVPEKYYIGDTLPNYENITKENLIFAGWYDNAEFTGTPVYSVPTDVSGDTTYYAKWVKQETLFDGFENGLGTGTSAWQDWTGKATMSIDTENVNSGDNSMKYVISENASYIYVTERTLSVNGDGICFWISTEKAATLKLQLDHYNPTTLVSKEINVPAGKSFVTIPWSDITATDKKTLKSLEFQIKTADAGNTYYIDDIGTYSNAGAHAFANGTCSECGAVEFDYNGDKECDIRDLVRLKRYLTDDSVDIKKSNDDNGTVENNDLVKLQKRLLGIS